MALAAASLPGLSTCCSPQLESSSSAASHPAPSKCNPSAASSRQPSSTDSTLCWGVPEILGLGAPQGFTSAQVRIQDFPDFAKLPLCPHSDRMAFGPVSLWASAERGFPVGPGKLCCPCSERSLNARGFHKVHSDQQIFLLPQGSQ